MQYLLLAWRSESDLDGLTAAEAETVRNRCTALDEVLQSTGYVIAMGGLEDSRSSLIVRVAAGRTCVTAGPFSPAREQIGGFYLIEARDLNEALHVAARTAASLVGERFGWCVEVRPVETMAESDTRRTLRNA